MKRLCCLLLALTLMWGCVVPASAEMRVTSQGINQTALNNTEDDDVGYSMDSGTCGENLTWSLSGGVLTISGTGDMYEYANGSKTPWQVYRSEITLAVVEEGVTSLSAAFDGCTNLEQIIFWGDAPEMSENTCGSVNAIISFPLNNTTWEGVTGKDYGGKLDWSGGYVDSPDDEEEPDESWKDIVLVSGILGDNLTWTLTRGGKLTVTGTGDMYSYSICNDNPIHPYQNTITSVILEEGVTSVGQFVFDGCSNLTEVSFPVTLREIGQYAFTYSGLTEVNIPENVVSIGTSAFYDNESLKKVTIPASVKLIGQHAFCDCAALEGIWVDEGNTKYCSDEQGVLYNKDKTTLVQAPPAGLKGAFVIPDSVTTLGRGAFHSCAGMTEVTLGEKVAVLESDVFSVCTGLTEVAIPASVTSIGQYAFYNCTNLKYIAFLGSAPEIAQEKIEGSCWWEGAFAGVTATACYPAGDVTWSEEVRNAKYGGTLTWTVCGAAHTHVWGEGKITKEATCCEPGERTYICSCGATKTEVIPMLESGMTVVDKVDNVVTWEYKVFDPETEKELTFSYTVPENGATVLIFFGAGCGNCANLLGQLESAEWMKNPYLNVVAVESNENDADTLNTFIEKYADGLREDVTFYGGGDDFLFRYYRMFSTEYTLYWPLVMIVTEEDGELTVRRGEHSVTDAEIIYDNLMCVSEGFARYEKGETEHEHSYTAEVTAPTCTKAGFTTYTCDCGDSYKADEAKALGHDWDGGKVTKAPTREEAGERTYTCTRCPETKTEAIEKLSGHPVPKNAVPDLLYWSNKKISYLSDPSLSKAWTYNYKVEDGTLIEKYVEMLQANGFTLVDSYNLSSWGNRFTSWAFTCDAVPDAEEIEMMYKEEVSCHVTLYYYNERNKYRLVVSPDLTVCDTGLRYDGSVVPVPHDYTETVTEPGCLEGGYTTFTCDCGDSYVDKETEALGHEWDKGKVTKAPTRDTDGERTYTCIRCPETRTEVIEKLGDGHIAPENAVPDMLYWGGDRVSYLSAPSEGSAWTYNYAVDKAVVEKYVDMLQGNGFTLVDSYEFTYKSKSFYSWGFTCDAVPDAETITLQYKEETDCHISLYYYNETGKYRMVVSHDLEVCDTGLRYDGSRVKLEHSYEATVTEPDCTKGGYTTYLCSCGHSYTGNETPAKGHSYTLGYCWICGEKDPGYELPDIDLDDEASTERLAGSGRWDTSIKVADQMKENLGLEKFNAIIIASGDNFADALAGSYLSAVKRAPILLCWNGGGKYEYLNQNILDYIDKNLAAGGTVYILGGKGAVPMSFDEKLGDRVERLNGANRFETNLMILREAGVKPGEEILVCTSTNFADSLSASATGKPILLVYNEGGKLFDSQKKYLASLSGNTFTILGGTGAVSEKMAGLIGAYGKTTRLAGANRFETSVLVAEKYFSDPDSAVLAYAWNYPDGLCGGGLAYSMGAPLILTMTKYETAAAEYIQGEGICAGVILGGTGLISDGAVDKIFSDCAAEEKPDTPGTDSGDLLVSAMDFSSYNRIPDNAVPDMYYWGNGEVRYKDEPSNDGKWIFDYTVDADVVEAYLEMLQKNGFTLVDSHKQSYRGDTYQSWGFTCDAKPGAEKITLQYKDTLCHLMVYYANKKGQYRLVASPDLLVCDTGLRYGGSRVDLRPAGLSAGAGLVKLENGSYQTSDGRLTASLGTAMILRDGVAYTANASYSFEDGDEVLRVENYYRNEGIYFQTAEHSLLQGDVFTQREMRKFKWYDFDSMDRVSKYSLPTVLVLPMDGIWQGASYNEKLYEAQTVRVMYYDKGGTAVFYIYAKTLSGEPGVVEALCVVNTAEESGTIKDATYVKAGNVATVKYTYHEFGTDYETYNWEIVEGGDKISIDWTGDTCHVTCRSPGVAAVKVTYNYTKDEPDVLTGIIRPARHSNTQVYYFIIE